MKTKLLMFLLSFIFYASPSLESDYENNDFIGLIKIISKNYYGYEFVSIQVWKTNFGDNILIQSDDPKLFKDGEIYLIFASSVAGKRGLLTIDAESIIYKKADIPQETLSFLTGQPCIDPSKKHTNACHRDLRQLVCGCNGKMYDNECEVRRDGVIKYKAGACTE